MMMSPRGGREKQLIWSFAQALVSFISTIDNDASGCITMSCGDYSEQLYKQMKSLQVFLRIEVVILGEPREQISEFSS